MHTGPVLVDLKQLRRLIDALDLKDAKRNEYLNARWLNYVEWWDLRNNGIGRSPA